MLAEQVDYVVGVDTHRDQHALAVVDAHTGAVIAQTTPTGCFNTTMRLSAAWLGITSP